MFKWIKRLFSRNNGYKGDLGALVNVMANTINDELVLTALVEHFGFDLQEWTAYEVNKVPDMYTGLLKSIFEVKNDE